MICAKCGDEIPTASGGSFVDNRYRGCEPCGWRMHHFCWSEALALDELPCPRGPERTMELRRRVPTGEGFTPTGRPRTKLVREVVTYREHLDDHGNIMGMRGEWEM